MRGIDEETGEYLSPSRSEQRREALAVLDLAGQLMDLSGNEVDRLPVDETLRDLIHTSKKITAQIARKRQMQFLAKQLRREDDAVLEALRGVLSHDKADHQREIAELHRIESWRDRLIDEGDSALGELLTVYPHADRQHLRQLARNAHSERLANKPPHSFRELFRELRELIGSESDLAVDDAAQP